jgi:hypothetical protein
LRGSGLDGEPAAELIFVGPDAAHGRACVTGDHRGFLAAEWFVKSKSRFLRFATE